MKQIDLKAIPVDDRVLRKTGAQFKGRITKDKDDKVEIQIERQKGYVPLDHGQQCVLLLSQTGDKVQLMTKLILDLVTNVLGGYGPDGRPSKQLSVAEMRPYTRVIEAFRAAKDGVVDLDEEDLKYLHRKFSNVTIVPHPERIDLTPVIVAVETFLSQEASKQ